MSAATTTTPGGAPPGADPSAVGHLAPIPARHHRDPARLALNAWGIAVFVFLFLPIVFIVVYSFNNGRLLLSWDGVGLDAYRTVHSDTAIRDAIRTSFEAAAGGALLSTVVGALAGTALARRGGKWSPPFLGLLALALVTPEIVVAVSLLPWFVRLGIDWKLSPFNNGMVRLILGQSLFPTAVVTFIVRARLTGLDESLEEAAADLYAAPWNRFRQITLPLMMPAILAGALMSFTLNLDDTVIASFVSVQGATPWPVYVFSTFRAGLRPSIAAMSTLMLAVTLLAIALVAVVLRRGQGKRGGGAAALAATMTHG